MFKNTITLVLFDKKQKVGDRIVGKRSTHEALYKVGRASELKVFNFLDVNGQTIVGKKKENGESYLGNI